MRTLTPIIRRGYTAWEPEWLPREEFLERVAATQELLARHGLGGLVVFGGGDFGTHDYADGCWLTGMADVTGLPDGPAVVVAPVGEPVAIGVQISRDLPYLSTLTWLEDFRAAAPGAALGDALGAVLDELIAPGAAIGTACFPNGLGPASRDGVARALAGRRIVALDAELRELRAVPRPRELALLARTHAIAADAAAAAEAAFAGDGRLLGACVAAERSARVAGARDVRVLANFVAGELWPFESGEAATAAPARLALYLAIEHQGYWGEAVATAPGVEGDAARAVGAMTAAIAPGVRGADVAAAGVAELDPRAARVAVAHGLGGGLGLGPRVAPRIAPDCSDVVREGAVVALRAFTGADADGALAARTLRVGPEGATALEAPPC